ncbi:MAG: pseudouridine synthase [Hallerella sp.]|nr:pseudouridine synthase [Hallerella sp.]
MSPKRFGVARILNKRGFCSRSAAEKLVREGRVTLDGRSVRDPEAPATESSQIAVDGNPVLQTEHVYFAMNKPRGIVTTASDEKGRKTVMDLLQGKLPQHVFPVGRLDKASEGLLLFTNDTAFADKILAPETHLEKEYHVQVSRVPSAEEMEKMQAGVLVPPRVFGENAEWMQMAQVRILRTGEKNAWLSVVLHEGKNREIRRILQTFEIEVLRLVRVRIGKWTLGSLKAGEIRKLSLDN